MPDSEIPSKDAYFSVPERLDRLRPCPTWTTETLGLLTEALPGLKDLELDIDTRLCVISPIQTYFSLHSSQERMQPNKSQSYKFLGMLTELKKLESLTLHVPTYLEKSYFPESDHWRRIAGEDPDLEQTGLLIQYLIFEGNVFTLQKINVFVENLRLNTYGCTNPRDNTQTEHLRRSYAWKKSNLGEGLEKLRELPWEKTDDPWI